MFSVRTNVIYENVKLENILYKNMRCFCPNLHVTYENVICPNICFEQKYDILCPILYYI